MMLFDDLADLALIEIFGYLSSVDILWSFCDLNDRLTALLIERSCFRHVNLSFARRRQFDILLRLLPLNKIESLALDVEASPLQLRLWPYLPRLTTLRLSGIYNYDDVTIFVIRHAATLTHLTLEPMKYYIKKKLLFTLPYPIGDLTILMKNILLRHLTALQSLDLGTNRQCLVKHWNIVSLPMSLTYLRLVLSTVSQLYQIMSTPPLSDTLQEFHVTMEDHHSDYETDELDRAYELPQMNHLYKFTFAKSFFSNCGIEWEIIEAMTRSSVMPVLRRFNLAIVIYVNDLDHFRQSQLFIDHRRIDVQFALSLIDWSPEIKPNTIVLRTSCSHPRQIASATFLVQLYPDIERPNRPNLVDRPRNPIRHHMWYTLPWSIDDFFQLTVPNYSITSIETFEESSLSMPISSSRLRTIVASGDVRTPVTHNLPHVVQLDRIETLEFYCDRHINIMLPVLRHVTLINSHNLPNIVSSLPPTVRSLHILLHCRSIGFVAPDWSGLCLLQYLPLFISLRVVFYDMETTIDSTSCQTLAQTAAKLNSFAIFFRPRVVTNRLCIDPMLKNQRTFIEELRHRIFSLVTDQQPFDIVESGGCGLTIWFD